jgi:hypothetical protein
MVSNFVDDRKHFCSIRRDDQKLPKDHIRAGGKPDWLTFMRMPAGLPVWTAELAVPNGGNVLPEFTWAHVIGVSSNPPPLLWSPSLAV